jgi:hypothetical protein
MEHYVKDEGEHGAPYTGFISIDECANVTVRDTILTGHKTYRTIGNADVSVSMGTYDISANEAVNVSIINCRQSNDINDKSFWGIMASNYSKNLLYDGCKLSRFDAHKGVCNATIRNSTIGHAGVNAIGHGILTIENTTLTAGRMISMREDYGSTWDGEFIIRNCIFAPAGGKISDTVLIDGRNTGEHDFGYVCHMPERVTIDGLSIKDGKFRGKYPGPVIFGDFNPKLSKQGYIEKYPIVRTKELILKNIKTESGKPLKLSRNPAMLKDVKVSLEAADLQGYEFKRSTIKAN